MAAPQVGTGATVAFSAAASFLADALEIRHTGIERPAIDITTLGTTGGRVFKAGSLYDPGEVEIRIAMDANTAPPIIGTPTGTLTITYPGTGIWAADAIMTGFEAGNPLEERVEATCRFKLSGNLSVT